MTRHVLFASAVALTALTSSMLARADGDTPPKPPLPARGINPLTEPTPIVGQTTTTAATLAVTTDPSPPPPSAEPKEERELVRPNRSMLITGSAILVGSYGASAIVGGISDTDADKRLFIPLVGPWLDLADRSCKLGDCGVREDVNILHIIGSGAAQATGLGIALASFFVDQRRSGRPAPQRPAPEPLRTTWRVIPVPGGIGAFGTF